MEIPVNLPRISKPFLIQSHIEFKKLLGSDQMMIRNPWTYTLDFDGHLVFPAVHGFQSKLEAEQSRDAVIRHGCTLYQKTVAVILTRNCLGVMMFDKVFKSISEANAYLYRIGSNQLVRIIVEDGYMRISTIYTNNHDLQLHALH